MGKMGDSGYIGDIVARSRMGDMGEIGDLYYMHELCDKMHIFVYYLIFLTPTTSN